MTLVITNCSARKKGASAALQMRRKFVGATLDETVSNWRSVVQGAVAERSAYDLYAGRAVSEARKVADHTRADLYFVSAGMGLIAAEKKVPAYDLTPVDSQGGLSSALVKHNASAADWWWSLVGDGVSRLIRKSGDSDVLIALPSTYIKMLALDLQAVRSSDAGRIRIFTSVSGVAELPKSLQAAAMPYDDRLESTGVYAGTRSDFPQRAMRHFVEKLDGLGLDQESSRTKIIRSLRAYRLREVPKRVRMTDAQVKAVIRKRWKSCEGRGAQLLRVLRDEELVACEQSRFALLWREVAEDMAGSKVGKARG